MLNTISTRPILPTLLQDVGNVIDTSMGVTEANAVLVSALASQEPDEAVPAVRILTDDEVAMVFGGRK